MASPWKVPVITTVAILVVLALFGGYRIIRGMQVVPAELRSQASQGPVNIQIQLGFPPEAFNVKYLQQYANAVSVKGDNAMLFGVTERGLQEIGSLYWVDKISPLGQG